MRLSLLGRFGVAALDSEAASIALPTKKTGALLAYLAMSRDYAASREELAALLWGGCSDQQARQSLRQALALLRKELPPNVLVTDTKIVRLEPAAWSIDARELVSLVGSRNGEDLARAARSFTGDFLSGFILEEELFEEWVSGQRTHLQHAAAQLCETFVRHPDLVIDPNLALAAVDQLIALDPLREDWHRLAIALYARYRGKNEAMARAGSFAGLLQRELGVAPERETRLMLENLRSADAAAWVNGPSENRPHDDAAPLNAAGADTAPVVPVSATAAAPQWATLARRHDGRTMAAVVLAGVLVTVAAFATGTFHSVLGLGSSIAFQSPTALGTPTDPWRSPAAAHETQLPNGIIPIVVLPFASPGGADERSQLIADMLTDDLTNTLSRLPSFRVISRQTARSYRGMAVDVAKLGTELQVRYALEGSARLEDDMLRVNVDLINPATRLSVWSGRVERRGADRQGVRDEIVSRLARELQFEMLPIESQRLSNDFDADALAYRGWAALSQVDLEGYKQALALFDKALERDPNNLSAQTGIGAYHARMAAQVLDTDPGAHRRAAEEILRRVLVRDPQSSQAHFYLALALNRLATLPEALEHLERAIKIDPSDASAHAQIGNGLIRSGKVAEGLEHVRYAMLLSPRDPIMPVWLEFAGNAELELGDYREAITMFERSIAINERYPRSWAGLVAAYALANQPAEARRVAAKLKTFAPTLGNDDLPRHFGRSENSKLHEGLVLAFSSPER